MLQITFCGRQSPLSRRRRTESSKTKKHDCEHKRKRMRKERVLSAAMRQHNTQPVFSVGAPLPRKLLLPTVPRNVEDPPENQEMANPWAGRSKGTLAVHGGLHMGQGGPDLCGGPSLYPAEMTTPTGPAEWAPDRAQRRVVAVVALIRTNKAEVKFPAVCYPFQLTATVFRHASS